VQRAIRDSRDVADRNDSEAGSCDAAQHAAEEFGGNRSRRHGGRTESPAISKTKIMATPVEHPRMAGAPLAHCCDARGFGQLRSGQGGSALLGPHGRTA